MRLEPTESISSMNIMQGVVVFARAWNKQIESTNNKRKYTKKVSYTLSPLANKNFIKFRAASMIERYFSLACNRSGQKRFSGTRRTNQKNTF